MSDKLKVPDLPTKWRDMASLSRGNPSEQEPGEAATAFDTAADELEAALSRQDAQARDAASPWQLPFSTVQRVVRALTQLGVAVPESSEEQSARDASLVELLCDEAAPGKLRVQPDQQDVQMTRDDYRDALDELWHARDCKNDDPLYRRFLQFSKCVQPQAEQRGAGDARAQFEAWAISRAMPIDSHPVLHGQYFSSATEAAWDGFKAALAARQPVGQEVVDGLLASIAVGSDGEYVSIRRWARDAAVAALRQPAGQEPAGHGMFTRHGSMIAFRQFRPDGQYVFTVDQLARQDRETPQDAPHTGRLLYTAPPAQVDLAQFRESVIAEYDGAAAIVSEFPDFSGVEERTREERLAIPRAKRDRLLALIDQQAGKAGGA